ncbi:MAG: MFS transporter [Candidatus Shapirobacteria bacterium]|nr:MFS transporter [Candidatus Shapirobacteria bacterium]
MLKFSGVAGNIPKYYLFSFLRDFTLFSAVLVPFFTQWGHISLTQVQLLQSWFMLWIFLLEVPTGAVADFLGRKVSLILGALTMTIGVIVYGSIPNFYIFLLGEFILATSLALMSGADNALLYDSLKELNREDEIKKITGRSHSFNLFGLFISAPIGSLIAAKFGLNAPMYLSSIAYFIATFVALSFSETKIQDITSESKRYLDIVKQGFKYFRNQPTLKLLALDAILVNSAGYFIIWLYQPLFTSINISVAYFGLFHALLVGSEILVSSNFQRLEKLFGSAKNYLRFSAIITAIFFLIVALFPNFFTIILFLVFAGGFGLTRMDLMSAYMNKFIPSNRRATILSSISMFRRFALVLLNPVIGFTADRSLSLALLIISLLPLVVFFFSPITQESLDDTKSIPV